MIKFEVLVKLLIIILLILIINSRFPYYLKELKILISVILVALIIDFFIKDSMMSLFFAGLVISVMYIFHRVHIKHYFNLFEGYNNKIARVNKKYNSKKDMDELNEENIKLIDFDLPSDDEDDKLEDINKKKNLDDYSPAEAQRETYRMIDTVKQLRTTVESLAPTLKEGKKILEAFKKLDFDMKDIK